MKLQGMDTEILVQSHNIELGDALPDFARRKIIETCGKYFNKVTECNVHFKKEGNFYSCSIRLKSGALKPFVADHTNIDIRVAFTTALEKVAKQQRRLKRELREDKGYRPDKASTFDNGISLRKSGVAVPEMLEDGEDDRQNLATMEGADDYVRAMAQKSVQDDAALENEIAMANKQRSAAE